MFDWTEYLAVADRLLADAPDEGALRSAISRAYYAVYHAAATFVRTSGILRRGHSHRRVWSALANDVDPARAAVGARGDQLRQVRTDADYRDRVPGDLANRARDTVREARALVEAIHRLV